METIYYITGLILIWVIIVSAFIMAISYLFTFVMNWIGRKYSTIWIMVEYAFYRKDFKEWVKDKERIKKELKTK